MLSFYLNIIYVEHLLEYYSCRAFTWILFMLSIYLNIIYVELLLEYYLCWAYVDINFKENDNEHACTFNIEGSPW